MNYDDISTLGIALGLGMIVGFQRERANHEMAGVRTFSIITALGCIIGFLTERIENNFLVPAFAIGLVGLLLISNYLRLRISEDKGYGMTTEVSALMMFALGVYLVLGDRLIAVIVGSGLAILLHLKDRMHDFIESLKPKDYSAIMLFIGISLIILPLLPDQTFGPMDVLNLHNIWLMVVLIVGISLIGYFIYKFVGKNVGMLSNGILGGLISSTATTISYARKTSEAPSISKIAAFVITTASAIALARIAVEVAVVIPDKLPMLILPLAAEFVIMIAICATLFYSIQEGEEEKEMPEPDNPAQFKSALIFGLLYGVILLAVAYVKDQFGEGALYIVSIISGLTDVDAITLSLSQLMKKGSLSTDTGWRLILLASLSNLLFKGIMAAVLGTGKLTKWIAITFSISIGAGLLIMWLWPETWHL